jgi:pyruvate kinase
MNDAVLGEKKNMNCPGTEIDLPTIGENDEADIVDFALKYNMDMIAASFIRSAEDVEQIRDLLGPRGGHIQIISKIENHQGLFCFDKILKASDGIMVARGDLGMEVAPEKVFVCQKWMIELCNAAGKPVVTATQMVQNIYVRNNKLIYSLNQ